jgi:hypothetical protein
MIDKRAAMPTRHTPLAIRQPVSYSMEPNWQAGGAAEDHLAALGDADVVVVSIPACPYCKKAKVCRPHSCFANAALPELELRRPGLTFAQQT